MKFKNLLKSIKPAEIVVLVIFVLYLIFPINTPSVLSPYIESPVGLLILFCVTVSLFVYSNPAIAVLFILVAYTLLRRSATVKNKSHYVQYTKTDVEKKMDAEKQVEDATPNEEPRNIDVGADQPKTLEEEIVQERAPIGRSEPVQFLQSSYKPIASNANGASGF